MRRFAPKEQIEAPNPTLIERFHDWKHEVWVQIRDFIRMQFSPGSRAHIRESHAETQKSKSVTADVFAQVPLLNSSQLVARWRQEIRPGFYSETAQVPLPSLDKGVYVVEATDGTLRAYTIAMVTELGLITKTAPGQALAFTANRRTGAPISDVDVRVWSDQKQIGELKTDSSGLAQVVQPEARYQNVRILAVKDNDVAVLAPYSYNLSSNPQADWTGYVYTDRPVYRPTHTIHFKVILRTRSGEHYRVPAGEQVQIFIEDPNSKTVLQKNFTLSNLGTIHGELELPPDAALGYYSISVRGPGGEPYAATGGFHVEEYKKPEYQVTVTPVKPRVLQGDAIEATIEAHYFFGEPVAGANVKYVVHTSSYWSPFIARDEEETSGGGEELEGEGGEGGEAYDYAGQQISEQSGKLDGEGKLKIRIPSSLNERHNDVRYRIEARVTDEGNREIAGYNAVIATYGSFLVGVSTESYLYEKGETIRAHVVARDYDGKPIQTHVDVTLQTNRYWRQSDKELVIASQSVETGPDGNVMVELPAKESGSLTLKATARTPEGREVVGSSWLWIPRRPKPRNPHGGRQEIVQGGRNGSRRGDDGHA
jgi:uncharacterized protein YfaS (alpha-2-macroglobulin family)